ncbi:MAG: hypothetical protein JJU13_18960 [Balneolaceae bacterium]|nr:hypothetical protein [Balneolaceae bacterium]
MYAATAGITEWVKTILKVLDMKSTDLVKGLRMNQAQLSRVENDKTEGKVTLTTM